MLPVARGCDLATLPLPTVNLSCILDSQKYSVPYIDRVRRGP